MAWFDEANTVMPLVSLVITLLALLANYFGTISSIKERLTKLETQVEPFWQLVQINLPKLLKQHTAFRKDELLDKMPSNTLSCDETHELNSILEYELKNGIMPDKTTIYVLVLGRLKQMIKECDKK